MTRDEFTQKLQELRTRASRVYAFGIPLALLLEAPVVVYVLKVAHACPKCRETAYWSLAGFAICSAIVAIFYLFIRHNISQYAPSCPACAEKVTWRNMPEVLASGLCPHCKNKLFRDL